MAAAAEVPRVAPRLDGEVDQDDGVLLHDADEQNDADERDDAELGLEREKVPAAPPRPRRASVDRMVMGWIELS